MAAATVDMNRTIISFNLNIIEEQRRQMYHTVNQYVDKVIDAGRQWTTRRERSHSTFLEIQKITSKAMSFLSLKCEEMQGELESETSNLIGRDEFTQQQKTAQIEPVAKPVTTDGKGKDDDTDDVKTTHTSRNPNLESDQQTRYQDVYNQLKSVLTKQDELEQQLNMKVNILREDTESLKSDVGTFNQYVETGKTLLKDYSQKLESLENTVSCLSEKSNEMYSDQQVLVDCINSHLSDKDNQVKRDLLAKVDQITTDMTDKIDQVNKDLSAKVCQMNKDLTAKVGQINTDFSAKVFQMNTDLSAKVNQINTELSHKVDEINTDLSAKVGQISTGLSTKVDQINVVLQTLTYNEKEHAAQKNKINDLEKHFNTMEKDTQNNDNKVQQRLDELGRRFFDVTKKLTQLSVEVDKKRDANVSNKVDHVNTDLSTKVDQINVVLQTLTNSKNENAAQSNKISDLEKHFNDIAQQQHDELLVAMKKLSELYVEVGKKNDLGAVGFDAATTLPPGYSQHSIGMFEQPAFIGGYRFNPGSGIFMASTGVYLAYVSVCLDEDGGACVCLIHEHTEWYDEDEDEDEDEDHWQDVETQICSVRADRKGSTMCSLDVITMRERDRLFIRNAEYCNVSCRIKFLCLRIG